MRFGDRLLVSRPDETYGMERRFTGNVPRDIFLIILDKIDLSDQNHFCNLRLVNKTWKAEVDDEGEKRAKKAIEDEFGTTIDVGKFTLPSGATWNKHWYPCLFSLASDKKSIIEIYDWMKDMVENEESKKVLTTIESRIVDLLDPLMNKDIHRNFHEALDVFDTLHWPNFGSSQRIVDFVNGLQNHQVLQIRLLALVLDAMGDFVACVRRYCSHPPWSLPDTGAFQATELCLLIRGLTPCIQAIRALIALEWQLDHKFEQHVIDFFSNFCAPSLWEVLDGDGRDQEARTAGKVPFDPFHCNQEDQFKRHGEEEDDYEDNDSEDDDKIYCSGDCQYRAYYTHAGLRIEETDKELEPRRLMEGTHEEFLARAIELGRFDLLLDARVRQVMGPTGQRRRVRYWFADTLLEILERERPASN